MGGRRRGGAPPDPVTPLDVDTSPYAKLYPPDDTLVTCRYCMLRVPSIAEHLPRGHMGVTIEDYQREFPNEALTGRAGMSAPRDKRRVVTVSKREAEEHPCGREGAVIEKSIDRAERQAYREDIEALLKRGYDAGYEVASLAYQMVLARRIRDDLEETRERSEGAVFGQEYLDHLQMVEARIREQIRGLDKNLAEKRKAGQDDPQALQQRDLAEAEAFIEGHIGEFQERCPGCGVMLQPPNLPHWAYEAIELPDGSVYFPVWSPELYDLVKRGEIRLWMMALALRTSIEALKITCQRRNEKWVDVDMIEEERAYKERLESRDKAIVLAKIIPRPALASQNPVQVPIEAEAEVL